MAVVTEPYVPGTPCWVDLTAGDQLAALDFYRDLFGWQGAPGPAEFGGYAVCTWKDRPVAGIGPAMAPPGAPAPPIVWTTYLSASDADATREAIGAAGGSVLTPVMDVGTLGRMLIAADPAGAVFGVWEPRDFTGAQIVNEPGALLWNELHTSDIEAAAAFYRAVFGIEITPMELPEPGEYWAVTVDGRTVGGAGTLAADPPGTSPYWLVYFAVDDPDSVVDAHVRRGGNVLAPPFDMVAGRMAVLADPQGAVFAVIRPRPMAEAG